jgi:hypothetical protein
MNANVAGWIWSLMCGIGAYLVAVALPYTAGTLETLFKLVFIALLLNCFVFAILPTVRVLKD